MRRARRIQLWLAAALLVASAACAAAAPAGPAATVPAPSPKTPAPAAKAPVTAAPGQPGTPAAKPAEPVKKRPEMPPSVQWRARVLTPAVLTAEPVILVMTWRNTGKKAVKYPDDQPLLFAVQKVDDPAPVRQFWLARMIFPDLMIPLEPGEESSRKIPVVLGWRPRDVKPPVEFMLPAPGKYRLVIQGAPESDVLEVTVTDPVSAEDVAARKLWTPAVAWGLVEGARGPILGDLENLCAQCPHSRYTAYALWMRAAELATRGDIRWLARSATCCEDILERHPAFPLREDTLKALVGMYATIREPVLARETFRELSAQFPGSPHLSRLREQYGEALAGSAGVRDVPPSGGAVPRAALTVSGMDRVPEGVRQVFERFLSAVAQGDFATVEGLLSRDFIGDEGRRIYYTPALWKQRRGADGGQMQVAVARATMVRTFERETSLPAGAERTWYGPLCVVEGSLSVRWDGGGSRDKRAMTAPRARWAFYEFPQGRWKLVSETTPSRNLRTGALAQHLTTSLRRGFPAWHITDGRRDRVPFEEIKTQLGLAGKLAEDRTLWDSHTIIMVGTGVDEANVKGRLRMLLKPPAGSSATAPDRWVERDLTLHVALGPDDQLYLKGMTVDMPDPRSESGSTRGPGAVKASPPSGSATRQPEDPPTGGPGASR